MAEMDVSKKISELRDAMKRMEKKTLLHALGIEITELSAQKICGTMPVDSRTHQLYGMLHGGASVAFAETLCSVGAYLFINSDTHICMGLEINANHIRGMQSGAVKGVATPVHIGRRTQVWSIEITNEAGDLVCLSRCTIAVVEKK